MVNLIELSAKQMAFPPNPSGISQGGGGEGGLKRGSGTGGVLRTHTRPVSIPNRRFHWEHGELLQVTQLGEKSKYTHYQHDLTDIA